MVLKKRVMGKAPVRSKTGSPGRCLGPWEREKGRARLVPNYAHKTKKLGSEKRGVGDE